MISTCSRHLTLSLFRPGVSHLLRSHTSHTRTTSGTTSGTTSVNTEENYRRRAVIDNNPYGDLLHPTQTKRPVTRRDRYLEAIRNIPKPRISDGNSAKDFLEIGRRTHSRNSVFYGSNPASPGPPSFSELGVPQELCYQLADVGVRRPTQIQADIIPVLGDNKNCVFIGPTGSGKTYCYLLPTIQGLLNANRDGYITRIRSPRIIIMAPSKELSVQIGLIVRHLTENLDITTCCLNLYGYNGRAKILREKPIDIITGTYSKILELYASGDLNIEDLQHIVIDEIDKFLDYRTTSQHEGFLQELVSGSNTEQDTRCQVILAGSLLTQTEFGKISSIFPDIYQYLHPRSHIPLAHLKQEFWFVKNMKKPHHFLAMMKHNLQVKSHTTHRPLIFCNFANTAYWLHRFLIDNHINNIYISHNLMPRKRIQLLRSGIADTNYPVVTTDLFSAGLDFKTFGIVVNYEFPFTYGDYLHRVGRTGRISTNADNCKAVSYVSHVRDKALFGTIRDSSIGNSCESHVLVKPNRTTGWIKKQDI